MGVPRAGGVQSVVGRSTPFLHATAAGGHERLKQTMTLAIVGVLTVAVELTLASPSVSRDGFDRDALPPIVPVAGHATSSASAASDVSPNTRTQVALTRSEGPRAEEPQDGGRACSPLDEGCRDSLGLSGTRRSSISPAPGMLFLAGAGLLVVGHVVRKHLFARTFRRRSRG